MFKRYIFKNHLLHDGSLCGACRCWQQLPQTLQLTIWLSASQLQTQSLWWSGLATLRGFFLRCYLQYGNQQQHLNATFLQAHMTCKIALLHGMALRASHQEYKRLCSYLHLSLPFISLTCNCGLPSTYQVLSDNAV